MKRIVGVPEQILVILADPSLDTPRIPQYSSLPSGILWLTLSKTFCKSINTREAKCLLIRGCCVIISESKLTLNITLLLTRNEHNQVWTSFSRSLLMFEVCEIGQQLLQSRQYPFLKNGITIAIFRDFRNIPFRQI